MESVASCVLRVACYVGVSETELISHGENPNATDILGAEDGVRALGALLGDLGTPTKERVEQAMQGHILGEAVLMGTYQRTKK